MNRYYIKSDGKLYGPVDENKIREKIVSGFFKTDSLLSGDAKEWVPVQQILEGAPKRGIPVLRTIEKAVPKTAKAMLHPILQPVSQPAEHNHMPHRILLWSIIALCAILLIGGGIAIYFYSPLSITKRTSGHTTERSQSFEKFSQVCQHYQQAVGVVVVTLEDANGKLLPQPDFPIGTAFAIAPNQFATNCHVAYGIKDQKGVLLENVLQYLIFQRAREEGIKTDAEFNAFIEKNAEKFKEWQTNLQNNIHVRCVEIRLSHSQGRSIPVVKVQIHPRYKATVKNTEEEYKNAEYDVAILHTSENVEKWFQLEKEQELYRLMPGIEIAYLGFPQEGLEAALNIERPEAIFKNGTINRISDFHNVDSTPEANKSIVHDIPTVGGASGSPIFLKNGRVIAILWGGSITGKNPSGVRISSAAMHNYALRIDAIDAVRKQKTIDIDQWLGERIK